MSRLVSRKTRFGLLVALAGVLAAGAAGAAEGSARWEMKGDSAAVAPAQKRERPAAKPADVAEAKRQATVDAQARKVRVRYPRARADAQ